MSSHYVGYTQAQAFPPHVSPEYQIDWLRRSFATHYRHRLPSDKSAVILDIACGFGVYTRETIDAGYDRVRGIDLSEAQIEYARGNFELGTRVERADALAWLREHPNELDCILAFDIIEHLSLDDLLEFGRLCRRALTPGGYMLIQTTNAMSPLNPNTYGDLTHKRAFTAQSLNQFARMTGLVVTETFELPPPKGGLLNTTRRALWWLVRPALHAFVLIVHGRVVGKLYTRNIGAVVVRSVL